MRWILVVLVCVVYTQKEDITYAEDRMIEENWEFTATETPITAAEMLSCRDSFDSVNYQL